MVSTKQVDIGASFLIKVLGRYLRVENQVWGYVFTLALVMHFLLKIVYEAPG